jgi:hypothetical protein
MPAPYPKTVVVLALLLSLILLNTVNAAAAAQQHVAHKKRPVKQEQPAPPPPPPTLEQMPAVPPKVSFKDGLLTIVAENSTLGDILRAVRTQTGAAVEVPPNATERVVTHLGPGVPRDVLASLLNGSHFNYVMLGSPTNPAKVDRVILTSKSGGASDGSAPVPQGQNNAAPVPVDEADPQPAIDISEQPSDDAPETAVTANDENQTQPPNGQPQVKTPEQLLRELQQQQQQQQQQQGAAQGQPQ